MAESVDKTALIASFVQITGANEERANICLSATDWDLPVRRNIRLS